MTIPFGSTRSAFLVLLAGSFAAGCGSANAPGTDEWTGSGSQAIVCEGAGIHPASCGTPPPVKPPVLPPTRPNALPGVVGCPAGTTCDFEDFTGSEAWFVNTLCTLDFYTVTEVTATASNSYSVGYCNTAGVGASELATWMAANPGSTLSATSPGLPTAAAGHTWITFDVSTGPAFPMPASPVACEAGHICGFDHPDPLVLNELGCSIAYIFEKTLLDGSDDPNEGWPRGFSVAKCPTSADLAGWAQSDANKTRNASTTLEFEGLPTLTATSGFTYLVYGVPGIGLTCSSCEGILNGSGGTSSGGTSTGSSGGAQKN